MRDEWSRGIAERAAAYWTPERTLALTAGKNLPFLPAESAPLLRALGILNGDGSMAQAARRKYQQINHLVALLEPAFLEVAARGAPVRIVDAGCGRSYLTFLLAWCFVHRWGRPVEILGVDRNADVIETCRRRFELTGLPPVLRFEHATLESLQLGPIWARAFGGEPLARPNALVALHACDTATDEALALAVNLRAEFVAVAPCCHAELARRWAGLGREGAQGPFAQIWRSPHLRREAGATITDVMRTLLLHGCGYEVTAMEFVPSEHTPKNTLLRAHRRAALDDAALAEYLALRLATGGQGIRLEELLPDEVRARLAEGAMLPS